MAESLLNLMKTISPQISGAQQIPSKYPPQKKEKKITPRHTIIKYFKTNNKDKDF